MNNDLTYKLSKYFVQAAIIYLLFKFVPKDPMNDKDILLITLIVVLAYAVFENFYSAYFKNDQSCNAVQQEVTSGQCNSYCSRKEHLGNVSMSPQTILPVVPNIVTAVPTQTITVPATVTMSGTVTVPTPSDSDSNSDNGMERQADGSFIIKPQRNPQASASGSRAQDGVLKDEMQFSNVDYNSMPVNYNTGSFEYGYSFLPPAQWYPVPPHPPVCVAEKQCPVCPVFTQGTNLELKEWDDSRRITPADEINVAAIEKKLNSGR
jgi:hypothetical protein